MNKEELKEYVSLMKEAEELKKQAERLDDEAKSLKAIVIDGMPKGKAFSDSIGNNIAKIEKLRANYLHKYYSALCRLRKIERVINSLENPIERRLMRKRYVEGKSWEDICAEMNYSWKQIHRIHSKILNKIKDDIE